MPSIVNTNIASLDAQRSMNAAQSQSQLAMQRLSSGMRVNSAKDDASGTAIAARMEGQIRGSNQAIRNANDGISLSQTGEGALSSISTNLARMRELALQAANATTAADVKEVNAEFTQLNAENQRIVQNTTFNGIALLSKPLNETFQIGANSTAGVDNITLTTPSAITLTSVSLGDTPATAQAEIAKLDADIGLVTSTRTLFGSMQSRFSSVISQLQIASEKQSASRSQIMDADYAAETGNLTKSQIMNQASTAMLAQANHSPDQVLTLLR